MLRQRLVVNYRERTHSVEAVLQVKEDLARVLFLTPFGARALLVEQRGLAVLEKRYVPVELPFPPRFILLDIQRVWFPMVSERPRPDGDHEFFAGGELVRETWRARRLLHREFRRDSSHQASIHISYNESSAGEPPGRVVLVNERLGYTLAIETTATEFLSERACPSWWAVTR